MVNDPLSDFLIRIKNASLARQKKVVVSYSQMKENLAHLLLKEGLLEKVEVKGEKADKQIELVLKEQKGRVRPVEVRIISKPGRRVYCQAKDVPRLSRGLGFLVISTPSGLMVDKEAIKRKIGGEVICKII